MVDVNESVNVQLPPLSCTQVFCVCTTEYDENKLLGLATSPTDAVVEMAALARCSVGHVEGAGLPEPISGEINIPQAMAVAVAVDDEIHGIAIITLPAYYRSSCIVMTSIGRNLTISVCDLLSFMPELARRSVRLEAHLAFTPEPGPEKTVWPETLVQQEMTSLLPSEARFLPIPINPRQDLAGSRTISKGAARGTPQARV